MQKTHYSLLFYLLISLFFSESLLAQGSVSKEDLGKLFIYSIQQKQFKLLSEVLTPTQVYATIAPEEAANKNKTELLQMQKVVEGRLKSKWNILQEEAKFYKIKTKQLQFLESNLKEIPFQNPYLSGLEVVATYQQKQFTFLLITVKMENTWYLLDIAQQSQVFEQ